jgi:AmpD protein
MAPWQIDDDGWCLQARRYESPNVDARPEGTQVELLVVHNVSLPAGHFGGPHIADLFTNRLDLRADPSFADLRGLRVSAHFLVRRDGRVLQFASCDARAWHAGLSSFAGRDKCNDFSVGIELEGSDLVAFTADQYASLTALTIALARRYPLTAIVGHEHIAPGRKTDPGPCFDWPFYQKNLAETGQRLHPNEAVLVDALKAIPTVGAAENVKSGTPKK